MYMKLVVVGVGYWGPKLVRNFLSNDEIDAVMAYDLDDRKLAKLKREFPSVEISKSLVECLTVSDIAVIATPVSTHFELASQALQADCHVLVEKPMTATVDEGERLVSLASKKGKLLMVDHTFLFNSAVKKMKEVVDRGDLGRGLYFDSVRVNLGLYQSDVNVIWDLAPHDFSIMMHLVPFKPIAVQVHGMQYFRKGMEDMAYVTVFFEENYLANFHLSWLSPTKVRRITLAGDRRMLVYDDMESNEKVKIYDKGVELIENVEDRDQVRIQYRIGDIHTPALPNREALADEAQHFIDCIQGRSKLIASGQEGLWVVRLLEAADYSLRSGKKVCL